MAPTIMGVISDSTLTILRPRSGHGPKGHSSVITTHAGRFFVLPLVSEGLSGTGTALCTPTIATNGGVKAKRDRVSSRVYRASLSTSDRVERSMASTPGSELRTG